MPVTDETRRKVEELQAKYDRLSAHRSRVLRYYDDAPDGHRKKQEAREQLDQLGTRVTAVERELNEWTDRWEEEELQDGPTYRATRTTDEHGKDRWFVEDGNADWVEGPFDTVEHASQVARRLTSEG